MRQIFNEESAELAAQWETWLYRRKKAHRTVTRYAFTIVGSPGGASTSRGGTPLLAFLGPDRPCWSIEPEEVERFYFLPVRDAKQGERPPSLSVAKNKRAAVRSFMGYVRDYHGHAVHPEVFDIAVEGEGDDDGTLTETGTYKAVPKPVEEIIWYRLWRDDELPLDDRWWLGICYFFGLRVGEVANIRPENVDVERQSMHFTRKGGSKATIRYGEMIEHDWEPYLPHIGPFDQWVTYHEKLVQQRQADGLIFLSPQTTGEQHVHPVTKRVMWRPRMADITWYNKRVRKLLKAVGASPTAFTPHMLRHSCGTNLWRAGVSRSRIMDIMNHGKYETTLGYQDVRPEYDRERERNKHSSPSERLRNDDD